MVTTRNEPSAKFASIYDYFFNSWFSTDFFRTTCMPAFLQQCVLNGTIVIAGEYDEESSGKASSSLEFIDAHHFLLEYVIPLLYVPTANNLLFRSNTVLQIGKA